MRSDQKKQEIRSRVMEIINGTWQHEDLLQVLNWLRFRSHGNKLVSEIAHFVSHSDGRDSGISRDYATRMMLNVTLQREMDLAFASGTWRLDPIVHRPLVESRLSTLNPAAIEALFGLSPKKAKLRLSSVLDIIATPRSLIGQSDLEFIVKVLNYSEVWAPIRQDSFSTELARALISERLLERKEGVLLEGQCSKICAVILTIINLIQIDLGSGKLSVVRAGISEEKLCADIELPVGDHSEAFPLFVTNCRAEEWIEPGSEPKELSRRIGNYGKWSQGACYWTGALRLTHAGKIRALSC